MKTERPRSIKSLALDYLVRNSGKVVSREEIEAYVREARGLASAGEVTRRIRDLKQEGWVIETSATHPNLKPGQYRLASITKRARRQGKPERKLGSLIEELLDRPRSDIREVYEVLERQLKLHNEQAE